ncbi:MAG TPA: CoA-binding protein, partial [Cyclobacteriaceae bacterium]|nr:CoA-binding protein [Cyclobacteriaceae bacterium]
MVDTKLKDKRTVVVGASPNPSRYAFLAAEMLTQGGYEMIPVGIKKGEVFGK